jgi:hypothetical protein
MEEVTLEDLEKLERQAWMSGIDPLDEFAEVALPVGWTEKKGPRPVIWS